MRVPRTLFLFVPQLVALAFQLFPSTGAVLMMLGAPAWAVLLINGPMLALAIEASIRREVRLWLIPPAIWFGGYALFVAGDRAFDAIGLHRAESISAGVRVPFDPERQALLILGDHAEVLDVDNRARWFAINTNLPVAYLKDATFKDLPYAGSRLAPLAQCPAVGLAAERDAEVGISSSFITERREAKDPLWRAKFDNTFCVQSAPEVIDRPITTVTFERVKHGWSSVVVTIMTPGGRRQVLPGQDESGTWPWIPRPILGCGLNDAANAWQCGFRLMRPASLSLDKQDNDLAASNALAARALGLAQVAPEQRRSADPAFARVRGERLRERAAQEQMIMLDRVLADPTAKFPEFELGNLAGRPDLYGPRLPRVMALAERGHAEPEGSLVRQNARRAFGLVKRLPKETITPYRARIDALGARDEDFELWEAQRQREALEYKQRRGR
jgi:hypothetical protein